MKKSINLSMLIDTDELFNKIGDDIIIQYIISKGYHVIINEELSKYVNIEKSMGTAAFYNLIVDAIESGKLSLEMIIGHIATKKIIQNAHNINLK